MAGRESSGYKQKSATLNQAGEQETEQVQTQAKARVESIQARSRQARPIIGLNTGTDAGTQIIAALADSTAAV